MKTNAEWGAAFDVYYNNITSNQAPGLNTYEKSLFLTKAEYEITLNSFSASSKGNNLQQGFDDSAKRQADFSSLMDTVYGEAIVESEVYTPIDTRSHLYALPERVFVVVNETFKIDGEKLPLQVIPLRFDEYTRLMSKPFKRPIKGQAWRLINSGDVNSKIVEIISGPGTDSKSGTYTVRFIRKPKPVIIGPLDGLTIDGYCFIGDGTENAVEWEGCELDSSLHEIILQRAVELAKIAWTTSGNDNTQLMMTAGTRSE